MIYTIFLLPHSFAGILFTELILSAGLGLVLSLSIALPGYRKHSLSLSGFFGALATGTIIFMTGGLGGFLSLILFFISSSVLSSAGKRIKREINRKNAEGARRSLRQVLANGGPATAAFLLYGITGRFGFLSVGTACLAAATADTWASEGGILFKGRTLLITTFKPVSPGESGGVSFPGTLLSLGGAFLIGLTGILYLPVADHQASGLLLESMEGVWFFLTAVALLGLAGSLFDSLLGASVQGIFHSAAAGDQGQTERRFSDTGTRNQLLRGLPFIGNSTVNFLSGLFVFILSFVVFL